ncbi:hypothetical protein K474DRAFT_1679648 [Panus rudis PR-1116 ss-1]|nr:hypothetical protein K474DRAFT_1679648 [Panus rudis PR-1116 ss-1]
MFGAVGVRTQVSSYKHSGRTMYDTGHLPRSQRANTVRAARPVFTEYPGFLIVPGSETPSKSSAGILRKADLSTPCEHVHRIGVALTFNDRLGLERRRDSDSDSPDAQESELSFHEAVSHSSKRKLLGSSHCDHSSAHSLATYDNEALTAKPADIRTSGGIQKVNNTVCVNS